MAAALEWVVWFLLRRYVCDVPTCPLCKQSFRWAQIAIYDEDRGYQKAGPTSFSCPHCHQTIGVPSWRKSFLRIAYLALLLGFLYAFFELHPPDDPVDLTVGYVGLAALGAIGIADWFIWRRLEPGSPSPFTAN
jgi:hypothetical protein